MSVDQIIVAILSLGGIGFTYWFFLMKKEATVSVTDEVEIVVEGGYTPQSITIPQGKTTKLHFSRKDKSSCLEEVVLPDFKIRKYLPVGERITVSLTPQKKGEFVYSCGMNMFHGKIKVV